jgi:hypothetical protein
LSSAATAPETVGHLGLRAAAQGCHERASLISAFEIGHVVTGLGGSDRGQEETFS